MSRLVPVTSPVVDTSVQRRSGTRARNDVRALAEYHSVRVDVPVRLNVNESPYRPDGWREELATALATVEWHRYPDRTARAADGDRGLARRPRRPGLRRQRVE